MEFDKITSYAQEVISSYSRRDQMFRELEQIFLLEDMGDLPDADWIKPTRHPDARNALLGAVRLMTATDPRFSAAEEYNPDGNLQAASDIERLVAMIWQAAGRVRKKPVHYDAVLAGLLYGEVQIAIKSVRQLLDANPGNKRLESVLQRTPIIFDVINPAAGYPVFDALGLRCYVSAQQRRAGELRALYGDDSEAIAGRKDTEMIRTLEYWDYDRHVVWTDGARRPILDEENQWGFIPIVCQICEGSELFSASQYGSNVYQTRQPFLYTLWKSNLVYRQNLSLTLQSSLAFAIGANPLFLYRRNNPSKTAPEMDFSQPGGRVTIDNDEDYQPLARQVLDNSILQMDEVYRSLATESTIYKQTLGEPLGANAPFSMVALLSQAGRLPLVPYQRMLSWAIGDAAQAALRMLKQIGGSGRVSTDAGYLDFDAGQIPDEIEITATLDIDLPQDERMNAVIALQLTQGEMPLASMDYVRRKYLRIEQPDQEQYAIWSERAAQARFAAMLQEEMARMQQMMQQQQQPMQPPMQPPPGEMPPGEMPPEDFAPANVPGAVPAEGVPLTQPLEPPMITPEGGRMPEV